VNSSKAQILDTSLSVTATGKSPAPVGSVLPAQRDEAKTFLREFTRELLREISPATKIFWLLSVAVLLSAVFYLGYSAYIRYQAQQQRNSSSANTLSKRIEEQEKILAGLGERLDQTTQQISDVTKAGSDLKQTNQSVLSAASLPTRLWNSYSKGTCLIAGSYILIDRSTGRPLRYPEVEMSAEERLLTIGTEVPLTPEGIGTIFRLEFVATGFHVGGGYVLTNRHIASEPWAVDLRAQFFISSTGATPRLDKLLAFFPGHRQPISLTFRTASKTDDVAVCTFKTTPSNIPALPLDEQLGAVEVGRHVVMMGYPTGPNRMLALLPEAEAIAVENEFGGSLVTLLDQLAKRKLINPLTTQGNITDLYKNRIVFDAATSEGSSGTPMLGESGKVIGITFAVLVDNRASNFAVPIEAGIVQLKRAGWRPQTK
jgi:S1-C subfamily serine protease